MPAITQTQLTTELTTQQLAARILTLRGTQVMLDSHLADMYRVETKVLNRAVKRNMARFPASFCFQLTAKEWDNLRFQIGTSRDSAANQPPPQGVFYDGQIFDAYLFATALIKQATHSVILIDNYVDESVLSMLSKRVPAASATVYTGQISKRLELDLQKHNAQYPPVDIHTISRCHDRFLILDRQSVYHIGASLKDLGKQCFAFSKMDALVDDILKLLQPAT